MCYIKGDRRQLFRGEVEHMKITVRPVSSNYDQYDEEYDRPAYPEYNNYRPEYQQEDYKPAYQVNNFSFIKIVQYT